MDIASETAAGARKAIKARKRNKNSLNFRNSLPLFVMLLPGLVILLVNNYMPMFGVIIAFKRYRFFGTFWSSLMQSDWVGFKNFEFFFNTPYAFQITRNTLLYNLAFVILDLIVPVALAIALNELRKRTLGKVYQSFMFLPYFLSWIIVSYLAFSLLSVDKGFINKGILAGMGLEGIDWYFEPLYWPFILTIFHMWKYTGYNIVVYLASITAIDSEYYEAAAIDGATKWAQIKHITLPMLQPIMIIMALLAVGRIFNADFGLFFNVPRNSGQLYPVTNVIDTYVYNSMVNTHNMGMTAAAGLYQAVFGCITVFVANFVVRKIDQERALF